MAADVGEQPEPIEAEGDEFERCAAPGQIEEFARLPENATGIGGGTGMGGGWGGPSGVQLI